MHPESPYKPFDPLAQSPFKTDFSGQSPFKPDAFAFDISSNGFGSSSNRFDVSSNGLAMTYPASTRVSLSLSETPKKPQRVSLASQKRLSGVMMTPHSKLLASPAQQQQQQQQQQLHDKVSPEKSAGPRVSVGTSRMNAAKSTAGRKSESGLPHSAPTRTKATSKEVPAPTKIAAQGKTAAQGKITGQGKTSVVSSVNSSVSKQLNSLDLVKLSVQAGVFQNSLFAILEHLTVDSPLVTSHVFEWLKSPMSQSLFVDLEKHLSSRFKKSARTTVLVLCTGLSAICSYANIYFKRLYSHLTSGEIEEYWPCDQVGGTISGQVGAASELSAQTLTRMKDTVCELSFAILSAWSSVFASVCSDLLESSEMAGKPLNGKSDGLHGSQSNTSLISTLLISQSRAESKSKLNHVAEADEWTRKAAQILSTLCKRFPSVFLQIVRNVELVDSLDHIGGGQAKASSASTVSHHLGGAQSASGSGSGAFRARNQSLPACYTLFEKLRSSLLFTSVGIYNKPRIVMPLKLGKEEASTVPRKVNISSSTGRSSETGQGRKSITRNSLGSRVSTGKRESISGRTKRISIGIDENAQVNNTSDEPYFPESEDSFSESAIFSDQEGASQAASVRSAQSSYSKFSFSGCKGVPSDSCLVWHIAVSPNLPESDIFSHSSSTSISSHSIFSRLPVRAAEQARKQGALSETSEPYTVVLGLEGTILSWDLSTSQVVLRPGVVEFTKLISFLGGLVVVFTGSPEDFAIPAVSHAIGKGMVVHELFTRKHTVSFGAGAAAVALKDVTRLSAFSKSRTLVIAGSSEESGGGANLSELAEYLTALDSVLQVPLWPMRRSQLGGPSTDITFHVLAGIIGQCISNNGDVQTSVLKSAQLRLSLEGMTVDPRRYAATPAEMSLGIESGIPDGVHANDPLKPEGLPLSRSSGSHWSESLPVRRDYLSDLAQYEATQMDGFSHMRGSVESHMPVVPSAQPSPMLSSFQGLSAQGLSTQLTGVGAF